MTQPTKEEIDQIAERMGEAVHIAWMEKRRKEKGWHSPEECDGDTLENLTGKGTRQINIGHCSRCHPCMKPYKDLPESEKDLDRQYPALFFKILEDMGFIVIQKPSELAVDPYTAWNNLKRWVREKKGVPVPQSEFMEKMQAIEQGK